MHESGAVVALAAAPAAFASPLAADLPGQVADNPLAATPACAPVVAASTAAGSTNLPDAEVEPYVSADPANPNHLVASFQQDRWNDGGSNGLTNVVSYDGGRSWNLAASQPKFSICEGAAPGSAVLTPMDPASGAPARSSSAAPSTVASIGKNRSPPSRLPRRTRSPTRNR